MNAWTRIIACCAAIAISSLAGCNRTTAPPVAPPVPANEPRFIAIARGIVDVEGGVARISALRDGIIARVNVTVGDAVKAHDELFSLDTAQAEITRDAAKADLDAATAQVQLLRTKLSGLKLHAERAERAAQAGAASDQTADDARQALNELNAEITAAQAGVEAAKQKLKQADYEITIRHVRTPSSGIVVAKNIRVGDTVAPGNPELFEVLPDAPRIVRAELNESFVGKVTVGMTAEIRAEGEPDKAYPARVVRIGEVFGPSKLVENPQEATDARDVECVLDLNGAPLRVGQRVQVRIGAAK
jgi:RND family efflux transporter MFP subunit